MRQTIPVRYHQFIELCVIVRPLKPVENESKFNLKKSVVRRTLGFGYTPGHGFAYTPGRFGGPS